MRAIAIVPGSVGARLIDRPEPAIGAPDQVKVKTLRVGICGTDREEVRGGRSRAPADNHELVIGHEMFGKVVETGPAVKRVKPGDFAVFTVRRGCGQCAPCQMGRSDMCQTGKFRERGIDALDGYQTEFIVDQEQYALRVPPELETVGVLMEPVSVVEKAIDEALRLQTRRDPQAAITPAWLAGRPCLVAGLGPIGLLGALVLRLRGGNIYGLDVVDAASSRVRWLAAIGGHYIDGRRVAPHQVEQHVGLMDLILDASGVAKLEFNLLDALAPNGIYVLTGIPEDGHPLQIPGAELISRLVLNNLLMVGSVNAAYGHFQMGVDDLRNAQLRWPGHVASLITNRFPPEKFPEFAPERRPEAIKEVVEWDGARN